MPKKTLLIVFMFLIISCILNMNQSVFAFRCQQKWVTYRTDVEVRTNKNEIMPRAFVRCYPNVSFKIGKGEFSRTSDSGIAVIDFQTCSEYEPLPNEIKARCTVSDPWDGKNHKYRNDNINVVFRKTKSRTSVYPARLVEIHNSSGKRGKKIHQIGKNNNRQRQSMNGHFTCQDGRNINIDVNPNGSWSVSNESTQLGGGGGGLGAAKMAARELCGY